MMEKYGLLWKKIRQTCTCMMVWIVVFWPTSYVIAVISSMSYVAGGFAVPAGNERPTDKPYQTSPRTRIGLKTTCKAGNAQ